MPNRPFVSIIVPTLEEAANLPLLVRRVAAAMSGRPYEVIVVDDDSRDGTADVAPRRPTSSCRSTSDPDPPTASAARCSPASRWPAATCWW